MAKTFIIHGDGPAPVAVEPMRDPNPFHNAAALIGKLDATDLRALRKLLDEREEELSGENVIALKRPSLNWVSTNNGAMAKGTRGTYLVSPFRDKDGRKFVLTISWKDDLTVTHLKSDRDANVLSAMAESHNEKWRRK